MRKDGEGFAAILRAKLRDSLHDVPIKQDRLLLEGGAGFWKQLMDAIDSVEFLVLVMTPEALGSESVRKEWRYARQQGGLRYAGRRWWPGMGSSDRISAGRNWRRLHEDLGCQGGPIHQGALNPGHILNLASAATPYA